MYFHWSSWFFRFIYACFLALWFNIVKAKFITLNLWALDILPASPALDHLWLGSWIYMRRVGNSLSSRFVKMFSLISWRRLQCQIHWKWPETRRISIANSPTKWAFLSDNRMDIQQVLFTFTHSYVNRYWLGFSIKLTYTGQLDVSAQKSFHRHLPHKSEEFPTCISPYSFYGFNSLLKTFHFGNLLN